MSNLLGQTLGRYHILEQLGEGGMAVVYKAYDTRLERDVAVKVIRTEKLTLETMTRTLKRFEREAKALAKLTHPNIVPITDYGEHDGKPYLVMPYLPGGTLKQRLKGKPMPWQDAVRLLIPIARALHYAHQQGIIHRDVKPSNILITQSGEPMLTDFGIAKILLDNEETADLTGTGMGVGTPEYMSPEQFQGKGVDARTDVYSLGVVLYEMVTGRKPYQADTPAAVLIKQANESLPRPREFNPNLPDQVEKMLFKALAKNPDNRFQDMSAFADALEKMAHGEKVSAEKKAFAPTRKKHYTPSFWGILLVTVTILVGFIAIWGLIQRNWQGSKPAHEFSEPLSTSTPSGIVTLSVTPPTQWIIKNNYTSEGPLLETNPGEGYTDNTLDRNVLIPGYFRLQVQFSVVKGHSATILLYGQEGQGTEWWQGIKRFETGLDSDTDVFINLHNGTQLEHVYINHFIKPEDGIWIIQFGPQGKSFSVLNSNGQVLRRVDTTQVGFPDGIFPEGIKRIALSCGPNCEAEIRQLILLEPAK